MGIINKLKGNVINESFNTDDLEKKYSSLLESLSAAYDGYLLNEAATEAEAPELSQKDLDKIDDFLEDAHDFIEKSRKAKIDHFNASTAFMLMNLGFLILITLTLPHSLFIAILLLIGQLIALVLQFAEIGKSANELKKLINFKAKLMTAREKIKDQKKKDKITSLIDKIEIAQNSNT